MSKRARSYYDSDLPPSSPLPSSDFDYGYSTASSPPPSSPIATHSAFDELASIAASSSPIRIPGYSDWAVLGKQSPIRGPTLNPISPKGKKNKPLHAPSFPLPSLRATLNIQGFPPQTLGPPPRLYNSVGEIPFSSDSDADCEDSEALDEDDPISEDEIYSSSAFYFAESSERYAPLPPRLPPVSTPSRRKTHSARQQRHSISTSSPSKFRAMFIQGSSRMASEPVLDLPDELIMDVDVPLSNDSPTPDNSPPLITPPIDDAPSIDMIEDNATITILPLHPDILSTAPCPDTSLTLPDLVATSLNDAIPTRVDSPAPPKSSQRTSPIAQSPAPEALPPPSPPPAPIEESSLNGDTTIEPEVQMNPIPDLFPPEPALESVECAPVPVEDIESRKRKSPPSRPSSPGPSKKLKIDEDIQDHESRGSDDEDCDENMPSEDELTGMIIETLAASRASSMTTKAIWRDLSRSRPHIKSQSSRSEKEWIAFLHEVLQDRSDQEDDSGVFGKVQKNKRVKDPAFPDRRGGEPQWFYIPENDPDRERADLLRAIMPRSSGKRAATKTLKRYYFKPLEPLKSAWEEEGGY